MHALLVSSGFGKGNAIDGRLYEKARGIIRTENSGEDNTPRTSIYFKLLGSASNVMSRKSKGKIWRPDDLAITISAYSFDNSRVPSVVAKWKKNKIVTIIAIRGMHVFV